MAKRLATERNISVREAEQQLDADAYVKEQWQWAPSRLHCEYLCQLMFLPATATSQSEHNCTIHWGRREPLPEPDLGAEPTTMELVYPDSTQEDMRTSTGMCTNSRGYLGEADVGRLPRSTSVGKSLTPLRYASSSSDHLHNQRGNGGSHQLMSLSLTHVWSLLLHMNQHMRSSLLLNMIHMRE